MKKINLDGHNSEATIQAEFYHNCKIRNIDCFLEFHISGIGRLDAVIDFLDRQYIVEFKKFDQKGDLIIKTRQMKRYLKLELPIFIISSFEEIEHFIHALYLDLKFDHGIYLFSKNFHKFLKID